MLNIFDFDKEVGEKEPISIKYLLKEVNLPVRLMNILVQKDFYSEEDFYKEVDKLTLEHTSYYLFPNRLISFYPQVIERCAKREITCNLSGARIKEGSFYYTYHPFMEDLKSGRVYTISKKIHAELSYIDYFPQNLFTYEEWYYKLKNAYYEHDDIIDFYFLSRECGENCLDPYLLNISKKKRK